MKKKKSIMKKKYVDIMRKTTIKENEIEKVTQLLKDHTLRGVEKHSLSIYLKSLLKDEKRNN